MKLNLRESWEITRRHLNAARALLPLSLVEYPACEAGSIKGFEDFLPHNELELALEELAGLGEANDCRGAFWRALAGAADHMELFEQADDYCGKAGRDQ